MLKYDDIITCSKEEREEYEEFDPENDPNDNHIQSLERKGHKAISIGRAHAIIEQCETNEEFPEGFGCAPLKISIFPEYQNEVSGLFSELYIGGNEYGLAKVMLKNKPVNLAHDNKYGMEKEATFFDRKLFRKTLLSNKAQALLLLDYFENDLHEISRGLYWAETGDEFGSKRLREDEELSQSSKIIKQELLKIFNRLDVLQEYQDEDDSFYQLWLKHRDIMNHIGELMELGQTGQTDLYSEELNELRKKQTDVYRALNDNKWPPPDYT